MRIVMRMIMMRRTFIMIILMRKAMMLMTMEMEVLVEGRWT